jgi:hypothetical protein
MYLHVDNGESDGIRNFFVHSTDTTYTERRTCETARHTGAVPRLKETASRRLHPVVQNPPPVCHYTSCASCADSSSLNISATISTFAVDPTTP